MERLNKKITEPYNYSFRVSKPGLVAISISARCKSRKQLNSNRDEDLRVEINGFQFREIPPKKYVQLFNIPASWNGSKLKGLKKTIVFLTVLEKGEHLLVLISRDSAFIEGIEIKELAGNQNPEFNLEEQAEDGDRRPWYTFVLVDLPLRAITAKVTTQYRWWDSDDVKVIIDNKVQKQPRDKLHIYWFFAGILIIRKLIQKTLKKRETKKHRFKADLPQNGPHYIEFWADKTPILHKVELDLGEIGLYPEAKVTWPEVNLREKLNSQSRSLAVLKKDEKIEILEKAVEGEAPYKKEGDYCNIWHRVKIDDKTGYIFSRALEIEEESEDIIKEKIIEKTKEFKLDQNLILSIAKSESQYFPYAVSSQNAKGIFQIMPDAITDISEKYGGNIKDPFNIEQNIDGGIRYFKNEILKKYKGEKDWLRKALIAWHDGVNKVPKKGDLILSNYTQGAQTLVTCILDYYQKLKQAGKILLRILLVSIIVVCILSVSISITKYILDNRLLKVQTINREDVEDKMKLAWSNQGKKIEIGEIIDDLDGDGKVEEILFNFYINSEDSHKTEILYRDQKDELYGSFYGAKTLDLDQDGQRELLVKLGVGVNGMITRMYRLNHKELQFIPLVHNLLMDGFSGYVSFIDYDDDGNLEVRVDYRAYPSDICKRTAEIYEYTDGKFIKTEEIKTFEENCRKAMEEFKG